MSAKRLFDKIWDDHVVATCGTMSLLYVDCHLLHEGSRYAFDALRKRSMHVRSPEQTFACADHYVPTIGQRLGPSAITNPEIRSMLDQLERNTAGFGVHFFGFGTPDNGIVHVVAPEQGLTLPGTVIVCGDSHTSTHGAFGAIAFGIGASEVTHVLATQTLWQRKPKVMQVLVDGAMPFGVGSKDLALDLIARLGTAGATGFAIEYAGSTIRSLSMEQRMTLCNLSIEAGARMALIAPDETTFQYVRDRPLAPKGARFEEAMAAWRGLSSDPGAVFDREVRIAAADLAPIVTWGTSPEDAVPITGRVPDPEADPDPERRQRRLRALHYMGLVPGTPMADIPVDRVFIGSCTTARIEDLREAAQIVKGQRTRVPAMVVPGSGRVKKQAEDEGLASTFVDAGFEWRDPGCSMCLGTNGDTLKEGERCASTSNRNFVGRQGKGGRTHLVSATMAAAAAIAGHFTDVRTLKKRG